MPVVLGVVSSVDGDVTFVDGFSDAVASLLVVLVTDWLAWLGCSGFCCCLSGTYISCNVLSVVMAMKGFVIFDCLNRLVLDVELPGLIAVKEHWRLRWVLGVV